MTDPVAVPGAGRPAPVEDGRLVSRSVAVPDRPVRAVLRGQPAPRAVWAPPDGPTVVTVGAAAAITAAGADRFDRVRAGADTVFGTTDVEADTPPAARPRLVGGFSFHADHEDASPWSGFPAAGFVLPRLQFVRRDGEARLTVNAYGPDADPADVERALAEARRELADSEAPPLPDPPGITGTERVPGKATWREGVGTALSRIRDGTLRKVVLAQSLRADLADPLDPAAAFVRLGERYPGCHRFLIAPTDGPAVFGATPERLVSVRGRTVETVALAGSTGRGATPEADAALARSLADSEKDRHEHALVVDAIRDQLDPLAASVTAGDRRVRRLDAVQHLETPIRARLAEDTHVLSLVEALHPTPAVGGLPPDAAQAVIRRAESFARGWYAAPIGWLDARGHGAFAVGIRSAVGGDRSASLFAGAGIVADSDPDAEWEEVQLKYRPVLDALER